MGERELVVMWQFNGDNRSYCNLRCPECYGHANKTYRHYWNGDVEKWERAFERLNRDLYFVFSYGEALVSNGFFDCVEMIGRHPSWTLCVISNLMAEAGYGCDVEESMILEKLVSSRLAQENRLFIVACWHPEGVANPERGWEIFKSHLLMLRKAKVPVHVMMVWFLPVIKRFPAYFEWLDSHGFRVGVRRYVTPHRPRLQRLLRNFLPRWFSGKMKLMDYSVAERGFLYAYTCPKVTKYSLDLVSTYGRVCSAGKDLILVRFDGAVVLCADCCGDKYRLGNVFDLGFRLRRGFTRCPTNTCGGDYGMLHLVDEEFGELPERLWRDTFISQVEGIPDGVFPVPYLERGEMLRWLEELKCGK